MTDTSKPDLHVGMLGDGTEEQNLNQPGAPSLRIKKDEVEDAFEGAEDAETPDKT